MKQKINKSQISWKSLMGIYLRITKAGDLMISEYHNHHNAHQENHQIIPMASIKEILDNPDSIVAVDWQRQQEAPHIPS